MYCSAAATLAMTSSSRITLMAFPAAVKNWAANLPIPVPTRVANR
jgi:hypothetical protein